MVHLRKSLQVWGAPEFNDVLKNEIERLGAGLLPLQAGLAVSSCVVEDGLQVMIIHVSDDEEFIHVKAGIFYAGVIAGSCCADDPAPVDENSEYCEVQLQINKITGATEIALQE